MSRGRVRLSKISDIINGYGIRQLRNVETVQLGGVIASIIRICQYDCYVYGVGNNLEPLLNYLGYLGIAVKAVFDQNESKWGHKLSSGLSVSDPADMKNVIKDTSNSFVIISILDLAPVDVCNITKLLHDASVDKFYFIDAGDAAHISGGVPNRYSYYKAHLSELETLYDLLHDDESKDTLAECIRVYMQFGVYQKRSCDGRVKYFYGQDHEGKYEVLYTHLQDEVWLNCGSCMGDTLFLYLNANLNAKRIYAFEGEAGRFRKLARNLQLLPSEKRNLILAVNKYVNSQAEWSKHIQEQVTLVNADIEGNELDMLKALQDVLKRDRPVIAVCVYHKQEDLIEIPRFLTNLLSDYTYVMRKYESLPGGDVGRAEETVLYAIPNERVPKEQQWVKI